MKQSGVFLWLMIKRMGKHPIYWVLLLLFPTALFVVPKFNRAAGEERIPIGYIIIEETGTERRDAFYEKQLLDGVESKLLEERNGNQELFQYIKYTKETALKQDVLTGKVSCGVVFDEAFGKRVLEQDYRHCIVLYLPEGMNVGGMVQEDIFGRVYQAYSAVWYAGLLKEKGYQIEPEAVLQKFSEYQKEGKVFAVNYEAYQKSDKGEFDAVKTQENASVLSLRSILAFLTLILASLGALDGSRDRKRGMGKGISYPGSLAMITVGAPILPATLFLAGAMLLTDGKMTVVSEMAAERIFVELGSAFAYGVVLWLLAMLCSKALPEKLLEGVMPCFLLSALLCCPIFFDLGETIPLIRHISKLFPLTWYLEGG